MAQGNLYDPRFIRALFDEMASTYGVVNLISSLGFARRWRRQCLQAIHIAQGHHVVDLMTGMGELWPGVAQRVGPSGSITAIDLSPAMCRLAHERVAQACPVRVKEADALKSGLDDEAADCVVSSFGLKTLNLEQLRVLAREVRRVLRPGGRFSFLEISVPRSALLRMPYLAYIRFVIPLLGKLLMGNAENYRMLGVYTRAFGSCKSARQAFDEAGLQVAFRPYFFGCATGISGTKPPRPEPAER